MGAPEDFSDRPSRVKFLGSESEGLHDQWYQLIADYYDEIYGPDRPVLASEFLQDIFRRHPPMGAVLDVACGTFSIDQRLLERGYEVVGCDASPHMLDAARQNLRQVDKKAKLLQVDMRQVALSGQFDAVICLGTAFNYLHRGEDWRRALQRFRDHLRADGVLILDLTNFEKWIDDPDNSGVDNDYTARDGTRITFFRFNEQNAAKTQHMARFLSVFQRDGNIDIALDEAVLKVWRKESLTQALEGHGFRPVEWWGDLKKGVDYEPSESLRLICVALRE